MTFPKIATPEDIRKLQVEMHQLQNQQFLLATAALTVFGFAAWAIPRAATNGASQQAFANIHAASTIALLLLLSVLFAWSITLHSLNVTISHYLELRGASEWEGDYRAFHVSRIRPRVRSKTRWVSTIYFVLGVLIPGNFVAAAIISGASISRIQILFVLGASALYLLFIVTSVFFLTRGNHKIRQKWERLLAERHPNPQANLSCQRSPRESESGE
jgi:hypothetical protein